MAALWFAEAWIFYVSVLHCLKTTEYDTIFFTLLQMFHLSNPDSVSSHSACSFSGHKHYFLQQIEPLSDITRPDVFSWSETFWW